MLSSMQRQQLGTRPARPGAARAQQLPASRNSVRRTTAVVAAAAGNGGVVAAASVVTVPPPQQQKQQQHDKQHDKQQQQQQQPPRSASGRVLRDPARLTAQSSASVSVADAGGAVALGAYMRLPVEQYYVLDPSQISALDGGDSVGGGSGAGRFELRVPRVSLLGASLEPVLEVEVAPRDDAVVLRATRCRLRGEGALAGLDQRFALSFATVITWRAGAAEAGAGVTGAQQQQQQQQQQQKQPARMGTLTGSASIEVFCEVRLTTAFCCAVLRFVLLTPAVLPAF